MNNSNISSIDPKSTSAPGSLLRYGARSYDTCIPSRPLRQSGIFAKREFLAHRNP